MSWSFQNLSAFFELSKLPEICRISDLEKIGFILLKPVQCTYIIFLYLNTVFNCHVLCWKVCSFKKFQEMATHTCQK